jgi:hypothetical protein
MHMLARLLAACSIVVFGPVAPASADPHAPPELADPQSGFGFTDNPGIVDPHPLPVEAWSRRGDDAIAVHFTTGSPECFGVHATAHETAEAVTVELVGGALLEAVGRACTMIAVFGTLDVPLQGPLGERAVLSMS